MGKQDGKGAAEGVTVELRRGKSKPFWLGHPWIFSGAIQAVRGDAGPTGAPCTVVDERGNPLGTGFYNPLGKIAVRLLEHRRTTDLPFEPEPFAVVLERRLRAAWARRAALALPRPDTDVYRAVNAEGDLLPGLIVDMLGELASVQLNSRQMYEERTLVTRLVAEVTGARQVMLSVTDTASKLEGIPVTAEMGIGEAPGPIDVVENGIRYRLELDAAQKTGFYADQRENHARFAAICKGARLLDLYCYVGGFGLNAAKGGAASVVQVDSSKPATTQAQANAGLNGLEGIEVVTGDAVTYLKEAVARGDKWDRIVCDPPKLANGRAHVEEALKKYARINTLAMSALEPGGLMLTCSCSRHISADEFQRMLTESGHRLRRSIQVFETWSQPGDHPTLSVAPEGRYLKAFLVGVE